MNCCKTIDIAFENKPNFHVIVLEAFEDVIDKDLEDIIKYLGIKTNNCSGNLRFDLVSKLIEDKIQYHKLDIELIKTSQQSRYFFLFFDKKTKTLFSINSLKKDPPKYVKALAKEFNYNIELEKQFNLNTYLDIGLEPEDI